MFCLEQKEHVREGIRDRYFNWASKVVEQKYNKQRKTYYKKEKKTLRNKSGIHERGIYGLSEQQ